MKLTDREQMILSTVFACTVSNLDDINDALEDENGRIASQGYVGEKLNREELEALMEKICKSDLKFKKETPMSTYWRLRCKQCEEKSPEINHGADHLREIFRAMPEIIAVRKLVENSPKFRQCGGDLSYSFRSDLTSDTISFLVDHEGHDIELVSEYGDVEKL